MRRLAAWCSAGIEDALAARKLEQTGGSLSACVLHGEFTFRKTRQPLDRHRALEKQAVVTNAARSYSGLAQARAIFFDARTPAVHAQAHRALSITGGKHFFP